MKNLSTGKMWVFAVGQYGWALLSGLIANWLVYFYQPDQVAQQAGQIIYIPQGRVILGVVTIIGGITAFGRIFDAITDPWIASLSDRCKSKAGRRIPFMKASGLPLSLATLLVFMAPVGQTSWINAIWLFIMVMAFYLSITAYCTPYTALIPELGHNQEERMNISTTISLTYFLGTATAFSAPVVWGLFIPSFERVVAMRITFGIFAMIALICLYIPVFFIREKDYVNAIPTKGTALSSLVKTFQNKEFRIFMSSDILYWIALTMFQTGLPFFVTTLLGLPESMATLYFVVMTALSLVFYIPINIVAKKMGKKKLVVLAFFLFSACYFYTSFFGSGLGLSKEIQGYILAVAAALPMAILGIIPQAMVADISQSDCITTGENREGMFYAARTFAFKLGQSASMLIFTAIVTIETTTGIGYRIVAIIAAVFCLLGGIVLIGYNEKKINTIINEKS